MKNRYEFIDGLKGYSAIGVVLYHYILTFASQGFVGFNCGIDEAQKYSYYFDYFPYSLISNTSFIYISIAAIALIPTLNFYSSGNADWIKKEAVVRYFRFLPSICLCSLISYLFFKFGLFYNQQSSELLKFTWCNIFYTGDMSFLSAVKSSLYAVLLEGDSTFNTVFWIMQVIFVGSYLSYFIIGFFGNLKKRYLIYIVLLLITLYEPKYSLFLAGIVAGDVLSHTDEKLFSKSWWVILILGFMFANFPRVLLNYDFLSSIFYSFSAFCFIIVAARSKLINKILTLKVFTYFGRNSFSLILIHSVVLFSFSCYTFVAMYESFGYALSLLITFLLAIPVNFIATVIFAKLVTQPTKILCSKVYSFIKGNL